MADRTAALATIRKADRSASRGASVASGGDVLPKSVMILPAA
jgi:hypothetical protein